MTPVAAADPEAAYYQSIEEFFVSRRGDPLFLSSADWVRIRDWRTAGIPLRVVLRGIGDALASHARSWGHARKVGSLAYCAAEVDVARERWQRALATGGPEGGDLGAILEDLARSLESAAGLGPHAAARVRPLAEGLRARCAAPGDPRELESWLGAEERGLLECLRAEAQEGLVAGLGAEVDRDLAPYAGRMPEKVLEGVRKQSLVRRLLEAHGLPRLSVFGL